MNTARNAALGLVLFLVACGGGSSGREEGVVFSSSNLRLHLSDSPVDGADSVFVTIDRVDLIRIVDGEETFVTVADTPQEFDLLLLQNDVTAVLGEGTFPPGAYEGIRLIVAAGGGPSGLPRGRGRAPAPSEPTPNRIRIDGADFPLAVPSGPQTGIKLLDPFTLAADVLTELMIDFNVRLSVLKLGSQDEFILKPRLTLIDTVISASINGAVASSDPKTPVEDATVSAQADGTEILSTRLRDDGTYRLSPLLPGTYTLVVTAPGFTTAARGNVAVTAATDLADIDFTLDPIEMGGITGTTLPGDETIEVHLVQDEQFLALTGADSVTGEFAFADVAVGTYDVVLYIDGIETARAADVVVTADTDTSVSLGLPE